MADIYTKGTRVWLTDKEQGWISAEVTNIVKTDDKAKLVLVDERGKVSTRLAVCCTRLCSCSSRKSLSILLRKTYGMATMTYLHYEIRRCSRQRTTWQRSLILTNPLVRVCSCLIMSQIFMTFSSIAYYPQSICTT